MSENGMDRHGRILTTPPPRSGLLDRSRQFAQAARRVAADKKVPLIDYHAEVLGASEMMSGPGWGRRDTLSGAVPSGSVPARRSPGKRRRKEAASEEGHPGDVRERRAPDGLPQLRPEQPRRPLPRLLKDR
jgi:hypothetical protein